MHYTPRQRSALVVIAHIARRDGFCDAGHGQIARLAGVGRTTVCEALKLAERLGHIRVARCLDEGRENVVTVDFAKWKAVG